MSASKANGSGSSDDAPPSKIPKIPGVSHGASNVENTKSSSVEETGDSVSTKHCTKDTGRSCKLTLRIDNLDDFLAARAEVKGEPVQLSGFKWNLTAEPENGGLSASVDCEGDTLRWHCKASYVIRLRSTKRACRANESRSVFDNENYGFGFTQIVTLSELRAEQYGYVENNSITLEAELTTYSCYVADGAYGERTRLHDVAFDFGTQCLRANKGFLAVNAAFFEAMFFGEFADKHKDTVSLKDVTAHDFKLFLVAIAPLPPPLDEVPQHVITLLRLAGQFQVDELIDRCTRALLEFGPVKQSHSFVERLKAADELLMDQFRDKLIEGATEAEIHEAAQKENKEKLSGETWYLLCMKLMDLRAL